MLGTRLQLRFLAVSERLNMLPIESLQIRGTLPHVIPTLLRELRRFSSDRAAIITDVNRWVLVGIRKDEVKDAEMVTWLRDDIIAAFDAVGPPNTTFGFREPDIWGYWTDDDDGT